GARASGMRSEAATVAEYLQQLAEDARKLISVVRKIIRKNLPKGIEERMNWGMISYEMPLTRHPKTYDGQPLMYAALAAQKNSYAVYLMGMTPEFSDECGETGKKLTASVGCVSLKALSGLRYDQIA